MKLKHKAIPPYVKNIVGAIGIATLSIVSYNAIDKYLARQNPMPQETTHNYKLQSTAQNMKTGDSLRRETENTRNCLEKTVVSDPKFALLKNAKSLCSGPFAQKVIGELAADQSLTLQAKKDTLLALFSKLQGLRADFLGEYFALWKSQMKNGIQQTPYSGLENAVSAFSYTMNKHKIPYDYGEKDFSPGYFSRQLTANHLECETSGYLFIQFGREVGLDLIGVQLAPFPPSFEGHFVVAWQENGTITHYIETNALLYDTERLYYCVRSAVDRSEKVAALRKIILKEASTITSNRKSLDALNAMDSASAISFIRDSLGDTLIAEKIEYLGIDTAKKDIERSTYFTKVLLQMNVSRIKDILRSPVYGIYTGKEWFVGKDSEWKSIKYIEAADLK